MTNENWEAEWLIALYSPWSIAPHPNFRESELTGAQRLALVVDWRSESIFDGAKIDADTSERPWEREIVAAARGVLVEGTMAPSIDQLIGLSENGDIPEGARSAAAIFASVALREKESHKLAGSVLHAIIESISDSTEGVDEYSPSARIILAALNLHMSVTMAESSAFTEAGYYISRALSYLPAMSATEFEVFRVSKGINWGSASVQRDCIRAIKSSILSLKSYLEYMNGDTWSQVIKNRSAWIDTKMTSIMATRSDVVLRDAFERKIDANSNTRHFGRQTPEQAGYRVLALAELSGRIGWMRSQRENLGKVVLLENDGDAERFREALRLLRQARATKPLQSAVSWIRTQGPTASLVEDATIISTRSVEQGWCTEQDLLVLEGASDFLESDQRDRAIEASLKFISTPQVQGELSWASWERLWKTLARLVSGSSKNTEVAAQALDYLRQEEAVGFSLVRPLARLVSGIEWSKVSPEVVNAWITWSDHVEENEELSDLFESISKHILNIIPREPKLTGLDEVAYYADLGFSADISEDKKNELATYLVGLLKSERASALRGAISHGKYQLLNVSVAFALTFNIDTLWDEIIVNLADPDIDVVLKNLAVDRLARESERIPQFAASRLLREIETIRKSSNADSIFYPGSNGVFAESIRLGAALGAFDFPSLMEIILSLSSADVKSRVEAARTIPYVPESMDVDWAIVLLLQLSHDRDPNVRTEACGNLVKVVGRAGALSEIVTIRIKELLRADGMRVPLAGLHSMQNIAKKGNVNSLYPFVDLLEDISKSNSNMITKEAAQICLDFIAARDEK